MIEKEQLDNIDYVAAGKYHTIAIRQKSEGDKEVEESKGDKEKDEKNTSAQKNPNSSMQESKSHKE